MRRALALARKAHGQTRPNPLVGCVIARGEEIVGEGFHARAGEPHAERAALAACTQSPRGATMYVTLEPCAHHGRTPPCTDAVIEAGIARVVLAQRDPNPQARGGVEKLRDAGIEVVTGVLEGEALRLNPAFNTFHHLGRPLVTLKWAMTADGCTSATGGHAAWISNSESRRHAHALRAASDAVVVGIGTALRDDARLTIRDADVPPGPPLRRVVLDSQLRLPPVHPLVTDPQGIATVACAHDAPAEAEARLRDAGATVWRLKPGRDGHGVSLSDFLLHLQGAGVQALLVEGGRHLAGEFLAAGLADRVAVFIAPKLIGSGPEPLSALLSPEPLQRMDQALALHHATWTPIGDDILLDAWITSHLFPETAEAGGEPPCMMPDPAL
ncbi:MAG: diaminohydroxyphosphoribosylaminopyrimidine deaminase [Candidatus Sumerlaeota bacterium]|nr:diaminohydroxyphosphoribosylaminopyrimidine deaminase [Candidatus Sumerlaeota bacterium]